ncbi:MULTISPECIES: 5-oxoprolinase subunit PxpA [unclassified Actinopolyspora]|uniref:LamB/YcsF family protein n=1 Tax=unclassified Actinopolyspora TaxID=2639451 RepID=UPI0013F68922|nr:MULTISPECIES: 5-oxoprolinase subunit PxpA [unclassified Actinopolyspora]NHD18681.1 LamB/YcsF family protein [Actinopolyspora sp. BKK2]NHE77997.1 LamB/YcsF family protein [Actinopolyspora sp. BKK1]
MDLNADLAESFGRWELGDDEALLRIVTSANVACGFHAGDPGVIRRACAWAAREGVAIGAQVGYRDLLGFGRRFVDMAPTELTDEVLYQIGALEALAGAEGAEVSYVKPHGALYNAIVSHREQASAVVEAVHSYGRDLAALGLPGSLWLRLAEERGLRTFREAFADRAYTPEGTLVPRSEPNAVLTDPEAIAARCLRLARAEPIEAVDGSELEVAADSICLHGDTPEAVTIARAVRDRLVAAGTTPTPIVRR